MQGLSDDDNVIESWRLTFSPWVFNFSGAHLHDFRSITQLAFSTFETSGIGNPEIIEFARMLVS